MPATATLNGTFRQVSGGSFGIRDFEFIKPDGTIYKIHDSIGVYTCSCPAFANRPDQECKHIVGLRHWNADRNPATSLFDAPDELDPFAPIYIAVDGFAIDPESGEVIGMVDDNGNLLTEVQNKQRFAVTDMKSAEWVLEMMFDADSEIMAAEQRIANLTANIQAMKKSFESRKNYLLRRFEADLRVFAAEQLKGKKEKSIKTPFGTLAFRATQERIEYADETKAIEWAHEHCPDAIAVKESILKTALKAVKDDLDPEIFTIVEPGENFSVKTGVK